MLDYLKTWRKEHARILEDLLEVTQLGLLSRAGQIKLQELKRTLETHLLSEDEYFYPSLKKAAETDAGLRRELFLFAADMEKITREVTAFFQKEEEDPVHQDLPARFRRLSGMIQSRISREEHILMKAFEKLAGAQSLPEENPTVP